MNHVPIRSDAVTKLVALHNVELFFAVLPSKTYEAFYLPLVTLGKGGQCWFRKQDHGERHDDHTCAVLSVRREEKVEQFTIPTTQTCAKNKQCKPE
jgi:hypothetical protein